MSTDSASFLSIATSGDVLFENPVEWCVIFVGVVLVSAAIQYALQWIQRELTNKYARMMSQTSQQEVTVVGVVAILLMLATAFVPRGEYEALYSGLFSWTTMVVFFVAFLYVLEMVLQYWVCSMDMARWKRYEEGRLDTDEADQLILRERHYRLAYDRFAEELLLTFQLRPKVCPLYENMAVFHKRFLARMTDFTYRCWLSLIVVALANFGRAMGYKPSATDDNGQLISALVYIAATGWFLMLVHGLFCLFLFRSMRDLVNKRLKRSTVGATIVPLGDPLRAVEFLQCIMLSLNYYLVVFILGIANTVKGAGQAFAVAIVLVIPFIAVMVSIPWVLWALSILSVLGSVKRNRSIVQRIVRESHGDYAEGSDDEMEERYEDVDEDDPRSNDKVMRLLEKPRKVREGPQKLTASRPLFAEEEAEQRKKSAARPQWLDDDELWDGRTARVRNQAEAVAAASSASRSGREGLSEHLLDYLYYDNVDGEDFDLVAQRVAPELVGTAGIAATGHGTSSVDRRSTAGDETRSAGGGGGSSPAGRPTWLEADEEYSL